MKVDGVKIREIRANRVLSMRDLEERSGVSYNTIWRLETGKTEAHPRTIRRLADALEVEPSDLLEGAGDGRTKG